MGYSNFIRCRIYIKIYIEKIKMFVVPTILITTPLFDNDDCNVPSITVTTDSPDYHQQLNLRTRDDQNQIGIQQDEQSSIFPQSLFDAARSDDVAQRESVEDFIASRLSSVTRRGDQCQCEALTRSIEDSLECPVCRDRVSGEVYQCHAGHVMCVHCRSRLLTCPVCRSLLTLPAIRNRALERLAKML